MPRNIFHFCAAVLAGSIIGVTYDRWTSESSLPSLDLDWPMPHIGSVSAESVPSKIIPSDDVIHSDRGGKRDITPVDAKVAAEFLRISSKYGLPSKDNLRLFNDFLVSYDRRLRSPVWIMEHMNGAKLAGKASRKQSKFIEDTTIHEYFRATLRDFRNSGYDRGHMAAAANHKSSQDALDQTFILSNVSPQERNFNQGGWEVLESYVRWKANQSNNLYCVTGPLYLPRRAKDGNMYVSYKVIGQNLVSVPTHYFKVMLIEWINGTLSMEAFLMPNDDKVDSRVRLDDYRVPIKRLETIERASGLIFFDQLPRDKIDAPMVTPKDFKPRSLDDGKSDKSQSD